ncbi:hypothetical protein PUN28_016048 [Cardiocondyla obscurior]|uniref:Uncharacterized protein n=1 Tax=Cardiocondyla obscurior TaxID=286306 RepID=A0AAW2EWK6_9HYME
MRRQKKPGERESRSSRSNLIKDAVRIAKRTGPRDEQRDDEAGRKEPALIPLRRGGARRYAARVRKIVDENGVEKSDSGDPRKSSRSPVAWKTFSDCRVGDTQSAFLL